MEILKILGFHSHSERDVPYYMGEEVKKFYVEAENDLKTPVTRLYDKVAKRFEVCP